MRSKIIGITVGLLILVVGAAGMSTKFLADINKEMETVVIEELPISMNVSRVMERALLQAIELQNMQVLIAEREARQKEISAHRKKFDELGKEAIDAFEAIHKEINNGATPSVPELHRNLATIEKLYLIFKRDADLLASTLEAGDKDSFDALLPDLNNVRNEMALEVKDFRRGLNKMARKSQASARKYEKTALTINAVLVALAALLGIGFGVLVIRA